MDNQKEQVARQQFVGEKIAFMVDQKISSQLFDGSSNLEQQSTPQNKISMHDGYTTSAAQKEKNNPGVKVAILNMANEEALVGGLLEDRRSQEAAICKDFAIVDALLQTLGLSVDKKLRYLNEQKAAKPLPPLGGVYSQNVPGKEGCPIVDVISSAAPDLRSGIFRGDGWRNYVKKHAPLLNQYKGYPKGYERFMVDKMTNVLKQAKASGATHVILGAFGCGVFKNQPKRVAQCFRQAIDSTQLGLSISFAIPKKDKNYAVFDKALCHPPKRSLFQRIGDFFKRLFSPKKAAPAIKTEGKPDLPPSDGLKSGIDQETEPLPSGESSLVAKHGEHKIPSIRM